MSISMFPNPNISTSNSMPLKRSRLPLALILANGTRFGAQGHFRTWKASSITLQATSLSVPNSLISIIFQKRRDWYREDEHPHEACDGHPATGYL